MMKLLMLMFAAFVAVNAVTEIPDRCTADCDLNMPTYKANACTACLADMSLPEFCQFLFERNGVPAPDGACDPYYTKLPTLQPTRQPSKKPTQYYFPTASPQTRDEYEHYFADKRSKQPTTRNPGSPPTNKDGTSDNDNNGDSSSSNGMAIGLGVGIGVVVVLFVLMCCIKQRRTKQSLGATEFGSGATNTMLPTESPQKKKRGTGDDEVALT